MGTDRHNVRMVLDRRLHTPPGARLLQVEGPVLIYSASSDRERWAAWCAARLERFEVCRRGGDLLLVGYRKGCLPELLKSVGA